MQKNVNFTKTSTFLFPLLDIPKTFFSCNVKNSLGTTLFTTRFVNSYLGDQRIDKYADHIFIVLRNYQDVGFDKFYSTLVSFPNFVDSYEVNDLLITVFSIPEKNKVPYQTLLKGLYSELEKDIKKLIIQNAFCYDYSLLPHIFSKSDYLKSYWNDKLSSDIKEQEVWGIILPEEEMITEQVILELNSKTNLRTTVGKI